MTNSKSQAWTDPPAHNKLSKTSIRKWHIDSALGSSKENPSRFILTRKERLINRCPKSRAELVLLKSKYQDYEPQPLSEEIEESLHGCLGAKFLGYDEALRRYHENGSSKYTTAKANATSDDVAKLRQEEAYEKERRKLFQQCKQTPDKMGQDIQLLGEEPGMFKHEPDDHY